MLTTKLIPHQRFVFCWKGEELSDQKPYFATVVWPNHEKEVHELCVITEYVGWSDFPTQHAFLTVNYNGLETSIEILDDEKHLSLVKYLTDIDHAAIFLS